MEELKDVSSEVVLTPGEILNRAREKEGLSLEDVSERLKLRPSLIRDIECNRFNQPNLMKTFIKGYIKSYASLLKVDEQTVLHAFDVLMKETEVNQQEIIQKQENEKRRIIRVNFLWSFGVVVLILLAVFLVVYAVYRVFFDTAENVSMTTGSVPYSSMQVDYGVRVSEDITPQDDYADVSPESFIADEKDLTADAVVNRSEEIKQQEFEALQAQVKAGKKPSLADIDTVSAARDDSRKTDLPSKAEAEAKARAEADRRLAAERDAREKEAKEKADAEAKARTEAAAKAEAENRRREMENQALQRAAEMRRKAETEAELSVDTDGTGEINILDHVQKQQDIHNSQRRSEYESSLMSGSREDSSSGEEIEIMNLSNRSATETKPESRPVPPSQDQKPLPKKTEQSDQNSADDQQTQSTASGDVITVTSVKKNVGSARIAASSKYDVVIKISSGESWIGVYADKKTLVNKVFGKDSSAEVTLETLPAKVVVGAPQFTEVYINGSRVELSGSKSGVPYRIELAN
jgi:cytoskeletal protein RodZ